jgi:rifampicin phosphotransferase
VDTRDHVDLQNLEFTMTSYLLDNRDPIDTLEKYSGGKATNMARLGQCGVPTPPWFCVSGVAFGKFLEQFKDTDLWALSHQKIEELFLAANVDPVLEQQITERLASIQKGDSSFAVRSSGIGEDSVENSFAGQFSSYLNQKTAKQILKSLRLCWASAFTERARSYRQERKISTTHFSMGVIIQRMIIADVAGVGFSRDPIHPMKREQMIISSVFGIGEGLVSGELDADHYYVERVSLKIDPHLVSKDHFYTKDENGGLLRKDVSAEKKMASSLSDDQIKTIATAMMGLEEKLQLPQDIEWVFEGSDFFCVQTRPIR